VIATVRRIGRAAKLAQHMRYLKDKRRDDAAIIPRVSLVVVASPPSFSQVISSCGSRMVRPLLKLNSQQAINCVHAEMLKSHVTTLRGWAAILTVLHTE